jgi:hypothetical protein
MTDRRQMNEHEQSFDHSPAAKLRAASITWTRHGTCPICGADTMVGTLDRKPIQYVCSYSPKHDKAVLLAVRASNTAPHV